MSDIIERLVDKAARYFGRKDMSEQARQLEAEVARVRKGGLRPMGGAIRGPFSDTYERCGLCRHFDKPDNAFTATNLCKCTMTGRDRWAGDAAKGCPDFDDSVSSSC